MRYFLSCVVILYPAPEAGGDFVWGEAEWTHVTLLPGAVGQQWGHHQQAVCRDSCHEGKPHRNKCTLYMYWCCKCVCRQCAWFYSRTQAIILFVKGLWGWEQNVIPWCGLHVHVEYVNLLWCDFFRVTLLAMERGRSLVWWRMAITPPTGTTSTCLGTHTDRCWLVSQLFKYARALIPCMYMNT